MSVSWVVITFTMSMGRPSTSAVIWAKTVSLPWPISVAPTCRVTEPSWFMTRRAPASSRATGWVPEA
jgi:hypothetical protein